jgi:hypothetical protein
MISRGLPKKGLITIGNKLKKECVKKHTGRQYRKAEEGLEA